MALQVVGWEQNRGNVHTAAQLRMYTAMLQAGNFSTATSLRARGGVHPTFGTELVVTQAGSPNMTVLVEAGMASIPGTESGTQGNYLVVNDAQVTLNITAAHASLARIDIVVINVRDAFYSGVNNDEQLQVIAGTPAGSPVAPAAPNNSIILAQVAVGAGVTSIVNANITDVRFYLAAAGGLIRSRNDAARPTIGTEVFEGQLVWSDAEDRLAVADASTYRQLWPGFNKLAESILGGTTASVTFSSISQAYRVLRLHIVCRSDTAALATNLAIQFNSDTAANYDYQEVGAQAATPGAAELLGQTSLLIKEMTAATVPANHPGTFTIDIPWYTGTAFFKTTLGQSGWSNGTASGSLVVRSYTGRWRSTAAINAIKLQPVAGSFITGSSFALYGLP